MVTADDEEIKDSILHDGSAMLKIELKIRFIVLYSKI